LGEERGGVIEVDDGLVHQTPAHLAPGQLKEGAAGQLGKPKALEPGRGAPEVAHRFVQDRARLAPTRALPPSEARRGAEARRRVALADLVQDLARLIQEGAALIQVAVLGAGEPDEL